MFMCCAQQAMTVSTLVIQRIYGRDSNSMLKASHLQPHTRGPWKLIYYEAYLEREDALGRERYLKSGSGRKFLKKQLRHYLLKNPSKSIKETLST
jgi:predicted GIY-YIG superfamily endonuclease